jgi:MFS family permease
VPLLTVPLYAGAVADTVDRRRLLLLSDVALALVTVGLIVNALVPNPSVPALFAAEALATAAYGFQRPARNALTPALVGEEHLLAAIAVEDVIFNLARVAGPALAGVLIALIGLAGAYAIDLATFAASLVAIWLLPAVPPAVEAGRATFRTVVEGFQFVRRKPILLASSSSTRTRWCSGCRARSSRPSESISAVARRPWDSSTRRRRRARSLPRSCRAG